MDIIEIKSLSIERKIGQMFIIGLPGTRLDTATSELLNDIDPGGVCLFARNIKEAKQVRDLNDAINSRTSIPPMISIDQEGGLVDRLRRIVTPMPAPSLFNDTEDIRKFAGLIAEILTLLGFNTNFAPVVDVIDEKRRSVQNGLQTRNFGNSAEQVIDFAGSFLVELQSKGIVGCLKHFPGIGASTVDSHDQLPQVNIDIIEFNDVDLKPYEKILKTKKVMAIMVAHAAFPLLDLQEIDQTGRLLPSSLNEKIISTLLRDRLGYEGVIITDDLEMGAIINNYGIGEASVMAVEAGADMLAICSDPRAIKEGFDHLLVAVKNGRISEDRINNSLDRIANLKQHFVEPVFFDQNKIDNISHLIANLKSRL